MTKVMHKMVCSCCKCDYEITSKQLYDHNKKNLKNNYCSKVCNSEAKTTKIKFECAECKTEIYKKLSEVKRSKTGKFFCSHSCAARLNGRLFPKRERKQHSVALADCKNCGKKLEKWRKKFCSRKCNGAHRRILAIARWKSGEDDGTRAHGQIAQCIKPYLIEKYGNKCSECGWNRVHPTTGKVPIQVDHIDGNWKNNVEENLRLLCPSCHSLTPTYGSLNTGNGRAPRRETYKKVGSS